VRNPRGVRGLRHEELIRLIDQAQEALGIASATRWEEQMSAEPREEGEELASRGRPGFRNSILWGKDYAESVGGNCRLI